MATTVVLWPIENGEFSLDGIHWQSRPVFENLELGKEYTFYQRCAETGETLTIETSVALTVVTHIHQYDAYTCTLCGQRRKLESIAITTLPDKTVYIAGDDLCVAGGKVTLYFSDGSESVIDLTDRMVGYFNKYVDGMYSITVSHESKSTGFEIAVIAKAAESISITQKPSKLVYLEGEPLDKTELVVTAHYNNGTSREVGGYTIALSFNLNSSGIYGASGTLSYDSNQVTLSGTSQQIFSPWVVEFNDNNFVVCNNKLWVVIVVGVAGLIIGAVIGFFSKAILRKNKT